MTLLMTQCDIQYLFTSNGDLFTNYSIEECRQQCIHDLSCSCIYYNEPSRICLTSPTCFDPPNWSECGSMQLEKIPDYIKLNITTKVLVRKRKHPVVSLGTFSSTVLKITFLES